MIASLRGTEGLPLAVVADQAGCFTMLAIGGALVTSIYGGGGVSVSRIAQRVLLFPPFVALLVGICMGVLGGWLPFVDDSLQRIGATLVPLALFSVGLQVRLQSSSEHAGVAAIGLAYKLAAAPLAIYVIGVISGIGGMMLTIGVLQSAMAPMISAAILAEQHDLEPQLANYVLALGIVLSFATVPLLNSWL
jgi:predicted permease